MMLMARPATSTTTPREMIACNIVSIFAQRDSTGVSVGENAVLVVNATNK